MTISQVGNNSIYSLGLYENKENKSSNSDFLSLFLNSVNNQDSVISNPQLMMKEESAPPDINQMSDSEFKEMLILRNESMKERGIDVSGLPDPSQLSDEEISALKSQMQEKHGQMPGMIGNGEMPSIPFMQMVNSTDETQSLTDVGGVQANLTQLLLNLLSGNSDNSDENNWFATQLQDGLSSYMSSADYLSLYSIANSSTV